jgi:hypothetical protein
MDIVSKMFYAKFEMKWESGSFQEDKSLIDDRLK